MKKYLFAGLAALLLTACTDEKVTTDGSETLQQTRFPIELEVVDNGFKTRGAIYDNAPLNISNVGVFCVPKTIRSAGNAEHISPWDIRFDGQAPSSINTYCTGILNQPAKVVSDNTYDPGTGILVWEDGLDVILYPSDPNWFTYEFFAYHPRVDDVSYTALSKGYAIEPHIVIDGSTDVIWAISDEPDASIDPQGLAYCNAYFSTYGGSHKKPHFHFKHLLSKLNFQVQLTQATWKQLRVDSIYIENLPNIIKPRFLRYDQRKDFKQRVAENKASFWPYDKDSEGTFYLRENNNSEIGVQKVGNEYKYKLSTDSINVGDGIMIPPLMKYTIRHEEGTTIYDVVESHHKGADSLIVTMVVKDETNRIYPVRYKVFSAASCNGWEQGMVYIIKLKLDPMKLSSYPVLFDSDVSVLEPWSDPIVLPDAVEVSD